MLMRDLICRALYRALRLATAIRDGLAIAARLAEPPRRRKLQPAHVGELCAALLVTPMGQRPRNREAQDH